MNLRETYKIYAALMRRGMPKHPNLWHFGGPGIGHKYEGGDGGPFPAEDAHDLITMHALRWALGRLDSETARNAAYLEVFSDGSCVIERGGEVLGESDRDILAAILAATAHLEPKGDDDAKRP